MKRSSWIDYTKRKAIKLNYDQKELVFTCSKANLCVQKPILLENIAGKSY